MKLIKCCSFLLVLLMFFSVSIVVFGDIPPVNFNNCEVCGAESGFDCGILCGHIKMYGFFNRNLLDFISQFNFFVTAVLAILLDIILLYTVFFMVFSLNTYGKYLVMTGTRIGRKKLAKNPVSAEDKRNFWKAYKICSIVWFCCVLFWVILNFLR